MSMWGPETEREWHEEERRNEARDYRERVASDYDEEPEHIGYSFNFATGKVTDVYDERGPLDDEDDEEDEPRGPTVIDLTKLIETKGLVAAEREMARWFDGPEDE